MSGVNYLFQAKTSQAFIIKIIGELLQQRLQMAQFRLTEEGIFLLQSDRRNEQLIDISLERKYFSPYRCPKPITFSINSTLLYKMLKCIKKKDGICLYITEDKPQSLFICIDQGNENNKVVSDIKIIMSQPVIIGKPEGYQPPINIQGKQFQKLKNLHPISKTMTITSKLNYIKFYCYGDDLFSRELVIGNENDEDNCHIKKMFKQDFNTEHITGLVKCAGQAEMVQVYVDDDNGLKIEINTGSLGTITVYIKSKELIQEEEEEKTTKKEEENYTREEDEEEEDEEVKKPVAKRAAKKRG